MICVAEFDRIIWSSLFHIMGLPPSVFAWFDNHYYYYYYFAGTAWSNSVKDMLICNKGQYENKNADTNKNSRHLRRNSIATTCSQLFCRRDQNEQFKPGFTNTSLKNSNQVNNKNVQENKSRHFLFDMQRPSQQVEGDIFSFNFSC